MIAAPAKHFAFPPYSAVCFNQNTGWSGVVNRNGFNCLTFLNDDGSSTGQVITTFENAQKIAEEWNGKEPG